MTFVLHMLTDTELVWGSIQTYVWGVRTWMQSQYQADPAMEVRSWDNFMAGGREFGVLPGGSVGALACLLQPGTPQCSQGHYADPGYSAVGKLADIMRPSGIALTPDSSTIVVADSDNHQILAVDSATGDVTTLAGSATSGSQDGVGTDARFNRPFSVAITPDGSSIIVADGYNHMLRQIVRSTRAVTTLAGSTTSGSQDGMVRDREKEGGVRSRPPANATIECTRGFLRPCRF